MTRSLQILRGNEQERLRLGSAQHLASSALHCAVTSWRLINSYNTHCPLCWRTNGRRLCERLLATFDEVLRDLLTLGAFQSRLLLPSGTPNESFA
jgi:hypothetical protein